MLTPALRDNLPAEALDAIRRHTSLGEPADVAHAMAYLASDEARYLTGQCVVVDGGTTSQSALAPGRRTGAPTGRRPEARVGSTGHPEIERRNP